MINSENKKIILALITIFASAFVVRLLFWWFSGISIEGDTGEYLQLAKNISLYNLYSLQNEPPFIPTIRRPPLYPALLAVLAYFQNGEVPLSIVVFVQIILDSLSACGVLILAKKSTNHLGGLCGGLFYAFHPGLIYWSTAVMTETVFTFLLVSTVLLVIYGTKYFWLLVAAGLCCGLSVLCRPIAFPLLLIFAVVIMFTPNLKRKREAVATLILVCGLTLSPWLLRCYAVSGKFVFVQGTSAIQVYVASRSDLDQLDDAKLWSYFLDQNTDDPYFKRLHLAQTPAQLVEADRFGLTQAVKNITEAPLSYLKSRVKTLPYLVLNSYNRFTKINNSFGELIREGKVLKFSIKAVLMLVFSFLPLVLGFWGLIRFRQNLTTKICALVWLYTLFIHIGMWIDNRFWIPVVPFLIVSATVGATGLFSHLNRTKIDREENENFNESARAKLFRRRGALFRRLRAAFF